VGVIDHPVLDMRVSAAFGLGAHYNGRRVTLTDLDPAAIDGTERVMLPARANFIKYSDDGRLFDALTRAHPNHRIYRSCFAHACAVRRPTPRRLRQPHLGFRREQDSHRGSAANSPYPHRYPSLGWVIWPRQTHQDRLVDTSKRALTLMPMQHNILLFFLSTGKLY
jgi:hypothetical protein